MKTPEDRRECTRVPFRVAVTLIGDHVTVVSADVRDISLTGLYAATSTRIPAGGFCQIELVLGGAGSEARLRMRGRIARVDLGGLAVEFLEMGLDSYLHLQSLVRYNTTDQARIEEEFRTHLRQLRRSDS